MPQLGIPIDIERSEISNNINASFLNVFGMGLYTVIYVETMYIYFTRESKRYIVPATITTLFMCNIVLTAVNWYTTQWQFVDNGASRDSVFVSLFNVPRWVDITTDIPYFLSFVLADGLLIWRCFFAWNRSFRVISLSLLLITTETAIFFVRTVLQAIYGAVGPNAAVTARINNLSIAGYFTTFATSLVTTILIAYRIYSASKKGVSGRRFKHITNIIIQSGAVYSLSSLVAAINPVLEVRATVLNAPLMAFGWYSVSLVNVIAGMATTIMVARVSMLTTTTTYPSTSIHLSGLQFQAHSTHHSDTLEDIEGSHTVGDDSSSIDDGLPVKGKVQ